MDEPVMLRIFHVTHRYRGKIVAEEYFLEYSDARDWAEYVSATNHRCPLVDLADLDASAVRPSSLRHRWVLVEPVEATEELP